MTSLQMAAEIFRSLSILAEDEVMLARAAKYLRKLAKEYQKAAPTLMSKEEYFRKLDEAEEKYRQGKYISFDSPKDMNEWLKSL